MLRREGYKVRRCEEKRKYTIRAVYPLLARLTALMRGTSELAAWKRHRVTKFRSMDHPIVRTRDDSSGNVSPRIHASERSAAGEPCAPKGNYLQRARVKWTLSCSATWRPDSIDVFRKTRHFREGSRSFPISRVRCIIAQPAYSQRADPSDYRIERARIRVCRSRCVTIEEDRW